MKYACFAFRTSQNCGECCDTTTLRKVADGKTWMIHLRCITVNIRWMSVVFFADILWQRVVFPLFYCNSCEFSCEIDRGVEMIIWSWQGDFLSQLPWFLLCQSSRSGQARCELRSLMSGWRTWNSERKWGAVTRYPWKLLEENWWLTVLWWMSS